MDREVSPVPPEASASAQTRSKVEPLSSGRPILEGIAAALDIPIGALTQPDGSHGDRARELAENAEALEIFAGITDRDARQRGLAYLRWIAEEFGTR